MNCRISSSRTGLGPAEVRDVDPGERYFTPHALSIERGENSEPVPESQPMIDAAETFLLTVFLRRYVTWYARRRRFAQMQGPALLCRQVAVLEHPC